MEDKSGPRAGWALTRCFWQVFPASHLTERKRSGCSEVALTECKEKKIIKSQEQNDSFTATSKM